MKRDDVKFAGAILVTFFLMCALAVCLHLDRLREGRGPTVDMARIEAAAQRGVISIHEASFWEPAGEEGP